MEPPESVAKAPEEQATKPAKSEPSEPGLESALNKPEIKDQKPSEEKP